MAETHGYPSVYCPSASRLSAFLITSVKRSPEVGRELLGVMVNASLFAKKSPSPPTTAAIAEKEKGEEELSAPEPVRRPRKKMPTFRTVKISAVLLFEYDCTSRGGLVVSYIKSFNQ